MSDTSTPINEALIESYFNHPDKDFGLKALTSLFDFHRRQTARAEDLSRAYLTQMTKLQGKSERSDVRPQAQTTSPTEGDRTPISRVKVKVPDPKGSIPGLNITI